MEFHDPDGDARIEVEPSQGLRELLERIGYADCPHHDFEIRVRTLNNGHPQIRQQCLTCGEAFGTALPRKDHYDAAPFNEEFLFQRSREEARRRFRLASEHVASYAKRTLEFQRRYDAYLKSPQWASLRRKVFARCENLCEGCRVNRATEVHHLTYRHFENELLFELVGICRQCHDRFHGHHAHLDAEGPCLGCRYQGDGFCAAAGVQESVALADPRICGPNLNLFEPLK